LRPLEGLLVLDFGHFLAGPPAALEAGMTTGEVNPEAFIYGDDRLRFTKPVYIGDTLHARPTIMEKRDSPKSPRHGIVVELCEVLNQRQEVVLACEHLLMVTRRETV
jgi:acyl dehydratase